MVNTRMKKVLSSIIITMFMFVHAAPMGLCITPSVKQVQANDQKPLLRSAVSSDSYKLEGDIPISNKNPKISLSLRDSDVEQVLRMLADKAGRNIIFHSSVAKSQSGNNSPDNNQSNTNQQSSAQTSEDQQNNNQPGDNPALSGLKKEMQSAITVRPTSQNAKTGGRTITLDLVNVPLNDAFKMITQVADLTYYVDNNTIIVASATEAQKLNLSKQEMMIIPVKYVRAAALADFLNKNVFSLNKPGLSNAQIAITNPANNEILIFGTKNDYLMAKKIVAQFDKKPLEETFTVNHTTPKEMAHLICSVLLNYKETELMKQNANTLDTSTSAAGGYGSTSGNLKNVVLGSGILACQDDNRSALTPVMASSTSPLNGMINSGSNNVANTNTGLSSASANSLVYNLASINNSGVSITYLPQKGAIIAMGGSPQQMELIKNFIAENDKKQPQALLEVSIVELTENGSKELDNTWNIWSGFFSGTFNGTTTSNSSYPTFLTGDSYAVNSSSTTSTTASGVTTTTSTPVTNYIGRYSGPLTVTYAINYLIKNGKGRILANPKIVITNGESSNIDLTSDYVASVTPTVTVSNGTTIVTKSYLINKDMGINVSILPFISPDGYVNLNIKPNYSTQKGDPVTDKDSLGNTYVAATLLQRRNLDLKNIRIKDGETFVIGGLMRDSESQTISKFPVLGDLPGVGAFFRNTRTDKEKSELVIMLTPKIVKDSEDVVSTPNVAL